jgi:hypothetical protein
VSFALLNRDCINAAELLEFAKATAYAYDNMYVSRVPDALIDVDPTLALLRREFPDLMPRVFRFPPMSWYIWHTDTRRGCAFNMRLAGGGHSLLAGPMLTKDTITVTEVAYRPNRLCLYNTQHRHAVLTLGEERFILSCGLPLDRSYDAVLAKCKGLGLVGEVA